MDPNTNCDLKYYFMQEISSNSKADPDTCSQCSNKVFQPNLFSIKHIYTQVFSISLLKVSRERALHVPCTWHTDSTQLLFAGMNRD